MSLVVRSVECGAVMDIKTALATLTEELIESHARSHYPYVMTSGPSSVGSPPNVDAGVYIQINSEVFGRISSVCATTWEQALVAVCEALLETRETRWAAESNRAVPSGRTHRST